MDSNVFRLLSPVLTALKTQGCNPLDNSKTWRVKWALFFIMNLIWIILSFSKLIHFINLQQFGNDIFTTYASYQIECKFFVFFYYKDTLKTVIEVLTTQFWTPKDINDPDFERRYGKMLVIIKKTTKWYFITFVITSLSFVIDPLVKGNQQLPMPIWYFGFSYLEHSPFYEILFTLQCISSAYSIICAVCMLDIFYFLVITFIITQFDIIKLKLQNINRQEDNDAFETLKQCVDQHNILLDTLKKTERIFQFTLVNQLAAQVVYICLTNYLYLIEPMSLSIKLPVTALASVSQTFLYCLSGEIITNKCNELADEAYKLDWERNGNKDLVRGIQMMILRSQKGMKITVGGVMELSLPNFITNVCHQFSSLSRPKCNPLDNQELDALNGPSSS